MKPITFVALLFAISFHHYSFNFSDECTSLAVLSIPAYIGSKVLGNHLIAQYRKLVKEKKQLESEIAELTQSSQNTYPEHIVNKLVQKNIELEKIKKQLFSKNIQSEIALISRVIPGCIASIFLSAKTFLITLSLLKNQKIEVAALGAFAAFMGTYAVCTLDFTQDFESAENSLKI